MPQAARKPSGAPTPGESGGSGADRNYSEMGQQIKEKYGRKPAAKAAPAPAPAAAPAPTAPTKPIKLRFVPNVLNVYQYQFSPESKQMMLEEEMRKNGGNLRGAFEVVAHKFGDAMQAAAAKDGVRLHQLNKRDMQHTGSELAKARMKANPLSSRDTGGVMPTPEQQAKITAIEEETAAREAAQAGADAARAFADLHGRELPETYDDPPELTATEMPGEEWTADADASAPAPASAPKGGKTVPAEAPDAPAPGFGDVKVSEQADDLGKKLRDGVKAWNSAKQTEEEPE